MASENAVDERNSAIGGDLVALEVENAQRDAAVGQRASERFDAVVANLPTQCSRFVTRTHDVQIELINQLGLFGTREPRTLFRLSSIV